MWQMVHDVPTGDQSDGVVLLDCISLHYFIMLWKQKVQILASSSTLTTCFVWQGVQRRSLTTNLFVHSLLWRWIQYNLIWATAVDFRCNTWNNVMCWDVTSQQCCSLCWASLCLLIPPPPQHSVLFFTCIILYTPVSVWSRVSISVSFTLMLLFWCLGWIEQYRLHKWLLLPLEVIFWMFLNVVCPWSHSIIAHSISLLPFLS